MFKQVLDKADVLHAENALVQSFIEQNKISVKLNHLVKEILDDCSIETQEMRKLVKKSAVELNFSTLIERFEHLIPSTEKQMSGAFYTPEPIADYMVKSTVFSRESTICDPSCGCGVFLLSAVKHVARSYKQSVIKTIEQNVFGMDISSESIRRANILLNLLALENQEDSREITSNLICGNSLIRSNWSNQKNREYDVIIGNPPYVKYQDIDEITRKELSESWDTLGEGNYNLYFAFFELGIDLLKQEGILSYITPNSYFTSLAARKLRTLFFERRLLKKVIDFSHVRVFDALTYTCISYIDKSKKETIAYKKLDNINKLKETDENDFSHNHYKNLNNSKWRLLQDTDIEKIRKIESQDTKLRDVADVRVGIATCLDSVYFLDGSKSDGEYYIKTSHGIDYLIEKAITKPIVRVSDFRDQDELDNNSRRIIFPYKNTGEKVELIESSVLQNQYPYCYKYLTSVKERLNSRNKGRLRLKEWYAYARDQGLNFYGEKLLTPTFSIAPRFLLEKKGEALFCNGYAVFIKEVVPGLFKHNKMKLSILQKILNSQVMKYYVEQTSFSIEGGYPCYQKNFIEAFGIPEFSDEELEYIEHQTNKDEVDALLSRKYGLLDI